MNPIETLKYHNKWRRNGEGEMCNPAELGVAIDTVIADYEVMQKQDDELRAYANRLANALVICDAQHDGSYIGVGLVREVLDESPAQSLADIRAKAIGGFIDAFRYEFEGPRDTDSIESFADQYIANRIKEG